MMFSTSFLVIGVVALLSGTASAGNTTCVSNKLDWYQKQVGETPCRTYERLRQICNSDYEVGDFRFNTPGDNCDEQLADCCCNSLAWTLSMLCFNCQWCTADMDDSCYDAGAGGYQLYLTRGYDKSNNQLFCSPNTNNSFTDSIQAATCNVGLKIPDSIYTTFWGDGAWFYTFSKSVLEKDYNSKGDKAFSKCPSTSSSSVSLTPTSSAPPVSQTSLPGTNPSTGSTPSSSSPVGPAVGGAVGGIVLIGLLVGLWLFMRRRKRARLERDNDERMHAAAVTTFPMYHPVPTAEPESHAISPNTMSPSATSPSVITSRPAMSAANQSMVSSAPVSAKQREFQEAQAREEARLMAERQGHASSSGRTGPSSSANETSAYGSSYGMDDDDRHADAGPVPESFLSRSNSGRLPPAYNDLQDRT